MCVWVSLCLCVKELWLPHLFQDLPPMLLALSCAVSYNTVIVLLVIAPTAYLYSFCVMVILARTGRVSTVSYFNYVILTVVLI